MNAGSDDLLCVAVAGEALVVASAAGELRRSTDQGKTWARVGKVTSRPLAIRAGPDWVRVASDWGVAVSTDAGLLFSERAQPLPPIHSSSMGTCVSAAIDSRGRVLRAVVAENSRADHYESALFLSDDAGTTRRLAGEGLNFLPTSREPVFPFVCVTAREDEVLLAGDQWTAPKTELVRLRGEAFSAVPSVGLQLARAWPGPAGSVIAADSRGGVHTLSGGKWTRTLDGEDEVLAFACDGKRSCIAGRGGLLMESVGAKWKPVQSTVEVDLFSVAFDGDAIVAVGEGGIFLRR